MSEFKKISEISKIRRGASPRPIDDPKWFGGKVGWVRIVDVTRSKRYLRFTKQHLSPLGEAKSVRVDKNDLIMSICATIGRPIIVDIPACIHDGFVQFYNIHGTEIEYFYYALLFAEEEFIKMGQHGTQANLNTSLVGKHKIFIPRLQEQRKIAKILTTVDNLLEKTEALIAKYQAIKQGMMQDLFSRGVDEEGRLRPPYSEAPELYKDSELGWIPKEWEIIPLRGFSNYSSSGFVNGPFGSDLLTSELTQEGVPVVYIRDIKQEKYSRVSTVCVTSEKAQQLYFCNVCYGDVLITKVGDPPCEAALYLEKEKAVVTQDMIRIRPSPESNGFFLFSLINSPLIKKAIGKIIIEGTRARVSLTEFKLLRVPRPSLKEQKIISKKQNSLQDRVDQEQNYLKKLKKIKAGLMQDLLTGKVRVKVEDLEKENLE